jgi:plastocyanin
VTSVRFPSVERFMIAGLVLVAACGGGGDPAGPTTTQTLGAVTITSATTSVLVGSSLPMTATARDTKGTTMQATVTWSSSSNAVATVSSAGVVSGVAAGTATITATAVANGVTVTATRQHTVTVPFNPVLTSVVINAPATAINLNGSVQLSATARDQAGGTMVATVSWASSTPGVATVNASTGLVTAVSAGTTTITVTAVIGTTTVNATQVITVSSVPLVLTSVAITASVTSVPAGSSLPLTAVARDQNGNVFNATISWSTSDASRATVNGQGVVTGVALGTVVITATATSGTVSVNSTITLTVVSGLPTSETVLATNGNVFNPFSVEIAVGGTVTWTFQSEHNVLFLGGAGAPQDITVRSSGSVARTFTTAGTFDYLCSLHSGMNGTVIVR